MSFTPLGPTIGSLPPPLPIVDGGTGAASASAGLAALGGLVMQAATPPAGFALVNGTPTIITWTTPNDGNNHRAFIIVFKDTATAETGGALATSVTAPDGTTGSPQINAGGQAAGLHGQILGSVIVKANTAVSLVQSSALTAGASTVWAEIWGL